MHRIGNILFIRMRSYIKYRRCYSFYHQDRILNTEDVLFNIISVERWRHKGVRHIPEANLRGGFLPSERKKEEKKKHPEMCFFSFCWQNCTEKNFHCYSWSSALYKEKFLGISSILWNNRGNTRVYVIPMLVYVILVLVYVILVLVNVDTYVGICDSSVSIVTPWYLVGTHNSSYPGHIECQTVSRVWNYLLVSGDWWGNKTRSFFLLPFIYDNNTIRFEL